MRLKQGAVADKAGYDRHTIAAWERGRYQPNFENFINWCEALGLEVVFREMSEKDGQVVDPTGE